MAKVISKHNNSNDCIVCGLRSDASLKTQFYQLDNNVMVGVTRGLNIHQSYPGRMHGGIIVALLDETIGRAINIDEPNVWAVTVDLSVKYRKPVILNQNIKCFGKVVKNRGKIFVGKGFIEDEDGNILAEATATYMKLPLDTITLADDDLGWKKVTNGDEPKEIEMKNSNFFEKAEL